MKWLGLIVLMGAFFYHLTFGSDPKWMMLVVAGVMAVWWIFEALPLGITAMLPLVAYPLLGIMSTKQLAPTYMSSVLFLFVGGFFVAIAMQRWDLHKRIALNIIAFFGTSPSRLMLGFMVATSFLSMWISNTATTVMMVAIGIAVIKNYEDIIGENAASSKKFASGLLMAIAYSASIGGIATLVGTPPNLAFTRIYAMSFPELPEVSFGQWFTFGLPITVILIFLAWLAIRWIHWRGQDIEELDPEVIAQQKYELGRVKFEEKWVGAVFVLMAVMWIFRKELNLGFVRIPGWSSFLPAPNLIDDGMVAVFCSMILFFIPTRSTNDPNDRVLDKHAIRNIPWETILLFGGGFALAKGIQESGLSLFIGESLIGLKAYQPGLLVSLLTMSMSFLTELTSNMASTEMILPILASVAEAIDINPLVLMVPATLAASCAFMLPAATAPNAIIFGSNRVRIMEMIKVGFWINIMSVLVISIFSLFVIPYVLS